MLQRGGKAAADDITKHIKNNDVGLVEQVMLF